MSTPSQNDRSSRIGAKQASSQEVLEALAQYLADPKNIQRLLNLFEQAVQLIVQPYIEALGSAYRRVYRRPTPRNCTALMKLEANSPALYSPHRYYESMKDQLVEGFALLGNHPVFSNLNLRRDLIALESRTLTLFFIPQLVRSKRTAANQRSLRDATSQLISIRQLDFQASLFFLRKSLRPDKQSYNPNLFTNLSFLAYRRFERLRLSGLDTRTAGRNLDAVMARVRRHSSGSRTLIGRTLVQDWVDDSEAPSALEAWASMLAGTNSYNVRSISRNLR